jgi:exodeoxyribonuclease VII large subunit
MGQIPFLFDKQKKKAEAPAPAKEKTPASAAPAKPEIFTVSDLQRRLRGDLEEAYPVVYVAGEISNFQLNARSGHAYFTLKDEGAQAKCVMFRDQMMRLRHRLNDGLQVIVKAKVTLYEQAGQLQLSVAAVEPKGIGARELEYRERVEKLKKEGLTADTRKRKIPAFPRCIGVVTSRDGAALRDVLKTILRRDPYAHVVFSFAQVQGNGAAGDIARALRVLDESKKCEVIVLCRGGGSIEDLWCFNEEIVARAICISSIPIVTGIGHETDTTIADLVSDLRVSTPTAAAERVTAIRAELRAELSQKHARLERALAYRLSTLRDRISRLSARLRDPRAMIERRAQRIDELSLRSERALRRTLAKKNERLLAVEKRLGRLDPAAKLKAHDHHLSRLEARMQTAIARRVERARHRYEVFVRELDARSPLAILGRGYSLVFDADGRLVKKASEVQKGDRLRARLHEGSLFVRVEDET